MRGRGLKLLQERKHLGKGEVAPRAGAWIETFSMIPVFPRVGVAPRAGAWIETSIIFTPLLYNKSPPVRGRGLKLKTSKKQKFEKGRPPCRGVD